MENKKSDGAMWKKTISTKDGKVEIFSVVIGEQRFTAWPNKYKKAGDKQPEYQLKIDTWKPDAAKSKPAPDAGDDSLPF